MAGLRVGFGVLIAAALAATPAHAQTVPPGPSPAGSPIPVPPASEDRARAVQCLSTAIAYEAGYEPIAGQEAVAEVVLNRARAGIFPKTVCGVVFAGSERRTGCQFSFTCDGSLRRPMSERVMLAARLVAEAALDGRNPARVAGAAWYHADYVSPYWAPSLVRVGKIGAHIFYRAPGLGDRPASGGFLPTGEPTVAALARSPGTDAAVATPPASPPPPFAPWGLVPIAAR